MSCEAGRTQSRAAAAAAARNVPGSSWTPSALYLLVPGGEEGEAFCSLISTSPAPAHPLPFPVAGLASVSPPVRAPRL